VIAVVQQPRFMATVFLLCPCGWLMQDNAFGYYCENPKCDRRGQFFNATVSVVDADVSGMAA
jgi:hypothetical protein